MITYLALELELNLFYQIPNVYHMTSSSYPSLLQIQSITACTSEIARDRRNVLNWLLQWSSNISFALPVCMDTCLSDMVSDLEVNFN